MVDHGGVGVHYAKECEVELGARLRATASLVATLPEDLAGAATLAGGGTLAATAIWELSGSVSVMGRGSLVATSTMEYTAAADLLGAALLSGVGNLGTTASAALAGRAFIDALASLERTGASTLLGQGFVRARIPEELTGAGVLSGVGNVWALASAELGGAGRLDGVALLAAVTAVYRVARQQRTFFEREPFTLRARGRVMTESIPDVWNTAAPMPLRKSRMWGPYVEDGEYAYSIAGHGGATGSNLIESSRYHAASDTWEAIADTPFAIAYVAAVLHDDGFVYGGPRNDGAKQWVRYDRVGNAWATLAGAPLRGVNGVGVSFGGRVWVLLEDEYSTPTRAWAAYDPVMDVWDVNAGTLPARHRRRGGLFVYSGKTYLVGGWNPDAGTAEATIEVYDPDVNTWVDYPHPLPAARYAFGWGVIGDVLYVASGVDGGGNRTTSVFAHNLANPAGWAEKAPCPSALSDPGCAVLGGRLHVYGGFDGGSTAGTVDHWVYG